MSEKQEIPLDLLADIEAVEDLANFKEEWSGVIESTLVAYDVTATERLLVIDDLYKNYTENNEVDVMETDVIDAIHAVRAAGQDVH